MLHEVFGNNFHGDYYVRLRGPAEGFILSPAQVRRYRDALCGVSDCTCGGGYGTGDCEGSAYVGFIYLDYNVPPQFRSKDPDSMYLLPAQGGRWHRQSDEDHVRYYGFCTGWVSSGLHGQWDWQLIAHGAIQAEGEAINFASARAACDAAAREYLSKRGD